MSDGPAAGWYPDPEDATQQRYWDGSQWTEHRAPLSGASPSAGSTPSSGGQSPPWPPATPSGPGWSTGGAPAGQYGAYGAQGGGAAVNVDPWLWQSIVATILCCLPFGVVGIVFAAQANSAKGVGDLATAQEKAKLARTWTLVAVGSGLVVIVAYFLFIASFVATF